MTAMIKYTKNKLIIAEKILNTICLMNESDKLTEGSINTVTYSINEVLALDTIKNIRYKASTPKSNGPNSDLE